MQAALLLEPSLGLRAARLLVGVLVRQPVVDRHGLVPRAVVVTVATTGAAFVWGVPWAAQTVANTLPDSIAEQVGDSTLTTLDSTWLEPSGLSEERQQALQAHFEPFLTPVAGKDLRVIFRSSPAIGANAMALPDGTISADLSCRRP